MELKNYEKLKATVEHRRAMKFVYEKLVNKGVFGDDIWLLKKLEDRVRFHDLDKSVLNLMISKELASEYHKLFSPHHMRKDNMNKKCSWFDIYEAILDYECSGYTKPLKPQNAYDFTKTVEWLDDDTRNKLLSKIEEFGLARSYLNKPTDADYVEYIDTLPEITPELIIGEIFDYTEHNIHDVIHLLSNNHIVGNITPESVEAAVVECIDIANTINMGGTHNRKFVGFDN